MSKDSGKKSASADIDRPLVVHVVYRLDIGGLETLLVNFIDSEAGREFRHVIICVTGFTDFAERVERDDIEILSLGKKSGYGLATHWRCWRILRQLKPSGVHTYNIGTLEYILTAYLARVPARIHAEHGRDAGDPMGKNRRHNMLRRILIPFVSMYVAVSRDLFDWLQKQVRIPDNKCQLIYNGVDTEAFCPASLQVAQREVTSLSEDRPVVATVGRLDPVKDHKTLILAFAAILENYRGPAIRPILLIAGEGPARGDLEREIKRNNLDQDCRLVGRCNDVAEFLKTVDVFVLTSIAEGMPVTILEAMASAIPVVASEVGGIAEIVKPGKTGLLIKPGDVDGFRHAIEYYLQNPQMRELMGRKGRDHICKNFNLEQMASNYADLYKVKMSVLPEPSDHDPKTFLGLL